MMVTYVLLVVVLFMPAKNGAQRWIWLNGSHTQSIQPSELVKFAVILLFAALIAANQKKSKPLAGYGFQFFVIILGSVAEAASAGTAPLLHHSDYGHWGDYDVCWRGRLSALVWLYGSRVKVKSSIHHHPHADLTTFTPLSHHHPPTSFSAPPEVAHQTIQSLIAVGSYW